MSAMSSPRLIGRIPVANIWLLFLYASDLARFGGMYQAEAVEDDADLPTLVARLLVHAVEARLHWGLRRGYRQKQAILTRVRGRIDPLRTNAGRLLDRGEVACRFEDLTTDTARNRLVRSALIALGARIGDSQLAHRCRLLAGDFGRFGVSDRRPSVAELGSDVMGRNDSRDRLMVALAKLAFDLALPTEDAGIVALPAAERDEIAVRRLFERAVGGFYKVEIHGTDGWQVQQGTGLGWQIDAASSGAKVILPAMRTDVILENRSLGRRLVIDTKFTGILSRGWYREHTLRSGHIYQMYAYLRSQVGRDALSTHAEGLLLHPSIDSHLDETVVIQGHPIRFATVDLTGSAWEIRTRLLDLTRPTISLTPLASAQLV